VEWALRTPQWSFLMPVRQEVDDNPRPRQLYVRPDDRWELNDLMQHHLPLADHLAEVLHEFATRSKSPETFQLPALRDVDSESSDPARSPENGTRDDIPEG
ncbi:MAG TPA: hypothetical protein VFA18_22015, partial [Gemmataceae bacterium]|nr:hypothetical protein [Gemmataceae bacterium]